MLFGMKGMRKAESVGFMLQSVMEMGGEVVGITMKQNRPWGAVYLYEVWIKARSSKDDECLAEDGWWEALDSRFDEMLEL